MDFKTYWQSCPPPFKRELAAACETSVQQLANIAHCDRRASPPVAATIERMSRGEVMRWDMRPTDWRRIWPDLARRKDAPKQRAAA